MEIKTIIESLRHCTISDGECCSCPSYHHDSGCVDRLHAKAADALESQQKRITELEERRRWIPRNKPPKKWKDENGDAINYLVFIPGVGVDIANWIEPARCWFCMGVPCKVTNWMPLPECPEEVQG